MGLSRVICKIPVIVTILVFMVLVGLSAWSVLAYYEPEARSVMNQVVGKYDTVMPEITISKGKASIKEKQPYYLNDDLKKGPIVVIDTRPDKQNELLKHFREEKRYMALSQDLLLIKDERQSKMFPLTTIPDITVNSELINKFVTQMYPTLVIAAALFLGIWFFFSKLFQMLMLGLAHYLFTQKSLAPPSYGRSCAIAVYALIIPVACDMFLIRLNIPYFVSLLAYLAILICILIFMYWDYVSAPPFDAIDREEAPINP